MNGNVSFYQSSKFIQGDGWAPMHHAGRSWLMQDFLAVPRNWGVYHRKPIRAHVALQTSQIMNSIFKDLVTKCESGNVQITHVSFSVQLPLLCLALYLPASPAKSPSERGTHCLQSSDVTFSKRHFKGYMWDSPQPSKHWGPWLWLMDLSQI